jgi:hypothetical protein
MTILAILGMIVAGLAIAVILVGVRRQRRGQSSVPVTPPNNETAGSPSTGNLPSPPPPSTRPTPSLIKLQKQVAASPSSFTAELAKAVQGRINDLITALTEAQSALSVGGPDALKLAAKKIVYCRWVTGHGWRRYLANFGAGANIGKQIGEALAKDMEPIAKEVAHLLTAQPAPALVRRDEGFALLCAACGESAATFQLNEGGVLANSISNVNRIAYLKGETAQRLTELLAQGSARAVLDHLSSPGCGGCPAYCPECARVYCQEHYAVEETWSGSWHEASYATCPLGHEREFE